MAGRGVQGESVTQGRGRSRTLAGDRAGSVALVLGGTAHLPKQALDRVGTFLLSAAL